jgi:uncharacterized protein YkwD
LLDDHNHFRSLHVDTPPVSWDPNLAQLAQSWVSGCTGEHTPGATYGQNINTQWSYDGNVQQQRTFAGEATAGWYSEISNYNYNDPDPKWDASFGHFSAVVWRATDKVGCGMSLCPGEDVNFPYRIIVICNYGSSTPGYSLKENIMPLK